MTYHFPDGTQRHLTTQYHVCDKRMFKKLTYNLLLLFCLAAFYGQNTYASLALNPFLNPHTYTRSEWQ